MQTLAVLKAIVCLTILLQKVQIPDLTAKKSKSEKFKPKKLKLADKKFSALPCSNNSVKQSCHDKKEKWFKKKDFILTTRNNIIKEKKRQTFNNTSQVICYNC